MFNLRDTLESGQIFRYRYVDDGAIVAHGSEVFFVPADGAFDDERIARMFRSDQTALTHDHPYVRHAIQATHGIRVIRQDPWECLVAFIISQNNHQKRIQDNVLAVSEYGQELEHGFHAFPQPEELPDEQELRKRGLGYRAAYVAALRDIDPDWLSSLADLPYGQAKDRLCTLKGVGPKVADCILLFSLGFDEACPEDTWMKKVFAEHGLTREDLGPQAGLIQQHLFHHARTQGRTRNGNTP